MEEGRLARDAPRRGPAGLLCLAPRPVSNRDVCDPLIEPLDATEAGFWELVVLVSTRVKETIESTRHAHRTVARTLEELRRLPGLTFEVYPRGGCRPRGRGAGRILVEERA